jgi:hypothetical protein
LVTVGRSSFMLGGGHEIRATTDPCYCDITETMKRWDFSLKKTSDVKRSHLSRKRLPYIVATAQDKLGAHISRNFKLEDIL